MAGRGGIFKKRESVLLVIVPVDEYYGFKHIIKRLDPDAFVLTSDCYYATGAYKKDYIPF